MKKIYLLLLLAMLFVLAGCQTKEPCTHESYTRTVNQPAYGFKEGLMTNICTNCGEGYLESIPATGSVKILVIGNSYSVDSASYLYEVCEIAGLENIVIGNAQIGGLSIDGHWTNIQTGAAQYEYLKNIGLGYKSNQGWTLLEALQDEAWDAIVFTPHSPAAGQEGSHIHIEELLNWLDENKTNPNAQIFWNLTWAWPQDSTDNRYYLFNNDQMTMYNATCQYTQTYVQPLAVVDGIIPTGTAIQNMRTSYLGDTMCRDAIHLSFTHGRLTAAVSVCSYVTGWDVSNLDQVPALIKIIEKDLPVVRQAVAAALEKPYEVTQCDAQAAS